MTKDNNLRLYEALAHEVAMDAAERRELTDEQRTESRHLLRFAHDLLGDLERARRQHVARKQGRPRRSTPSRSAASSQQAALSSAACSIRVSRSRRLVR